jgi:hypothetical protein
MPQSVKVLKTINDKGAFLQFLIVTEGNRLDLMSNVVIPAKAGAFQSDVVQYKNQIPPNPPLKKGGDKYSALPK